MATDYSVAANSVCQITTYGTLFGQVVMNTFYYRLDVAGGVLTLGGAFLDDFNTALFAGGGFYETYLACLPFQVVTVKADLQWVDTTRYIKRTYAINPTGTATHVATTANLSATIELRGNLASRRAVGTKHLPGLGGTAVAAGLVTAGLLGSIEDFGFQASAEVVAGTRTMRPLIFGRARAAYTKPDGTFVPALPKSYVEVTDFVVHNTARVLRRRTVGLGI